MDEFRRQGKQRCQERRANLPYARPESESEESVERVSRVLGTCHVLSVVQTHHGYDACHPDAGKNREEESLSQTYNGGGVIPLLTRMARDSLLTRRFRQEMRQVDIIPSNGLC